MVFISKNVIIDTCFWFALYNNKDQDHARAEKYIEKIITAEVIIPWPTLYETLNTKFVKNPIAITQFELILKKPNVHRLDDTKYKEGALLETFDKLKKKQWSISLVDIIIRNILLDTHVDYLVTFNEKDFLDILKKRPGTQLFYG